MGFLPANSSAKFSKKKLQLNKDALNPARTRPPRPLSGTYHVEANRIALASCNCSAACDFPTRPPDKKLKQFDPHRPVLQRPHAHARSATRNPFPVPRFLSDPTFQMQQPPAEMHPAVDASDSAAADAAQPPASAIAAAAAPDPSSQPAEAPVPPPEGSDPPLPTQKTVTWSAKLTSDSPTHAQAAAAAAESSQYVSRGPASSSSKGKNATDSTRLYFGLAPVFGRDFSLILVGESRRCRGGNEGYAVEMGEVDGGDDEDGREPQPRHVAAL
jgi:hypothetical protein